MDSGNSGSMQSSSCGDEIEEYDSRSESNQFSMFLNNPPLSTPTPSAPPRTTRTSHLLNQPPQSSSLQQQMFDPLTNYYMDSLQKPSSNQNSFLNLDMMWSKGASATARSEQNNNDLSTLMIPSSSSSSSHQQNQQAFLLSQSMVLGQTRENINNVVGSGSVPTTHHSLPLDHHQQRGTSLTNDQQNLQNNNNMGRNPKKRSRASRRAPTTVLTTDTTNFRAMVQEFTGIPAQPFSSPFPRTRLDLFGSSRSISSSHMDPPLTQQQPPYLLRPFAQKIQSTHNHHSFPPSSSMVENLLAGNNSTNNSATINYHLSQHHQNQHQHPLMQHNQILGFQSISQTPTTKYPIGSHQQPSLEISPIVDSHIKRGPVFEELSHVNNNNIDIGSVLHRQTQNMVPTSSDGVNNNMCNSSSENLWGTRTTTTTTINGGDHHGGILGNLSGIEERNCTSDFGVVKGQECAVVATTTRGEGTVESWINCSSSD
ncbi:hypothetical protein TSUD_188330 [Trifolium subterraneum]|uniref:VQ domain-containing protein n=1 Tax=Trifolium subterraneum TaxID=3900 RepID=A0A2Z6NXI1_TRISU|nr:hypothetical protein TSUD_188330 [Trifolium subterraneum]